MLIEKLFTSRVRKVMLWIIVSWFVIGGIILVAIPAWKASQTFNDLSYAARVDSIKFTSGHRGHPYVLMDKKWRLFTIEEMKVVPILQVGDSLVKASGSATLHVYRKKDTSYKLLRSSATYFLIAKPLYNYATSE